MYPIINRSLTKTSWIRITAEMIHKSLCNLLIPIMYRFFSLHFSYRATNSSVAVTRTSWGRKWWVASTFKGAAHQRSELPCTCLENLHVTMLSALFFAHQHKLKSAMWTKRPRSPMVWCQEINQKRAMKRAHPAKRYIHTQISTQKMHAGSLDAFYPFQKLFRDKQKSE